MANKNRINQSGGAVYNIQQNGRYAPPRNAGRRPPQDAYSGGHQPQKNVDSNLRRVQEMVGNEPRQMHIPMPPPEYQHKQNNSYSFRNTSSAQRYATRQRVQNLQRQMGTRPDPARRVDGYAPVRENSNVTPYAANKSRKKAPRSSAQWAIPESSAVYTSKGVYYNGRKVPSGRNADYEKQRRADQAAKKAEKARIKAEKKKKFRLYAKNFFVTLGIVFLLCCTVIGLLYRSTFTFSEDSTGDIDYTLRVGEKHNLSGGGNCYRDGIAYIDFSAFAASFGMVSVGSVDSMRFIIPDDNAQDSSGTGHEEYVIFTDGVRCAIVNGTAVIMEGPCRTNGLSVRVPFSFIENYINGIIFDKNAAGSDITVSPKKEKTDDDGNIIIPEISFSIRKSDTLSHVPYPS